MWKEWVMKEISPKSRIGLSGSKRVSSHPSETRRPAEAQAERSGEGSVTRSRRTGPQRQEGSAAEGVA